MNNRLRLSRLATGVLYFGPLLAGLMGQGWTMVLAFACVFLLWSVIIEPTLWPRSPADLGRPDAAVPLAALVATQLLLVIVCFAIGRGLGGVLDLKPALPEYLPLALSFLAVPASRLIWSRQTAAGDRADTATGLATASSEFRARALLQGIASLPDDVAEEVLQNQLTAIAAYLDLTVIRTALGDGVAKGKSGRAGLKALIVHATDPAISNLISGSAYPAQAFAAAGKDTELLGLFARRCIWALEDEPDLVADCPPAQTVTEAARTCADPATSAELHRLAGLLT